jgi:hypothetical protein
MIVNATTFKEVQDIFENTNEKEITVIFNSNLYSVKIEEPITSDVYQES